MRREVRPRLPRHPLRALLPLAAAIVIAMTRVHAGVIHVDRDASGTNDGSSWASAFRTLTSALAAAAAGDEIWIAEGTYKPNDADPTNTSRTQRFGLFTESVGVYGGFAGTETNRDQRDPTAHRTILSGDLNSDDADGDGDGFPDPTTMAENCYHVLLIILTAASNAVIDGVTIRGGNANGSGTNSYGGGVSNSSSTTFINCTISSNSASSDGGGVHNLNYSPSFIDCRISKNAAASYGGGLYNNYSSPTLTNCTVSANSASYGGGMANRNNSAPTITNCTISLNSASSSGGGLYNTASSPTLRNCTIAGNSSSSGGAILNIYFCSPIISNCTISANSASNYGGGVYNANASSPTISNSIVWGNTLGMQIYDSSESTASVDFCVVENGYEGGTSIFTDDPLLLPLGDHGGPTQTMPVSFGSPAIGAGLTGATIPVDDQRGFARDAAPDIGACEFQGAALLGQAPSVPAAIGASLDAEAHSDHATPAYQWYLGQSGDTSRPISGETSASLSLGPLAFGASVWVRVTQDGAPPSDSATRALEIRGTYDQWCDFHGLTGADRAEDACPTGDGITNLLKFALGLDPSAPSTLGSQSATGYDPATGTLKQTWTLSKTPLDLAFEGIWSDDLVNWYSTGITQTFLDSDAGAARWEISLRATGEQRRFLQLHVQQTP